MKELMANIIRIANELDKAGYNEEVDMLDGILKKADQDDQNPIGDSHVWGGSYNQSSQQPLQPEVTPFNSSGFNSFRDQYLIPILKNNPDKLNEFYNDLGKQKWAYQQYVQNVKYKKDIDLGKLASFIINHLYIGENFGGPVVGDQGKAMPPAAPAKPKPNAQSGNELISGIGKGLHEAGKTLGV